MTDVEQTVMERYHDELEDDMRHLLNKYSRIMGWSVPELHEQEARELILGAMRAALEKVVGNSI